MAFLKPAATRRTPPPVYMTQERGYDLPAEWHTRQAEDQDVEGMRRPIKRVYLNAEDYTTTGGGFLTEEVRDTARQGWAPRGRQDLADAARSWRKPWAQDPGPDLPE